MIKNNMRGGTPLIESPGRPLNCGRVIKILRRDNKELEKALLLEYGMLDILEKIYEKKKIDNPIITEEQIKVLNEWINKISETQLFEIISALKQLKYEDETDFKTKERAHAITIWSQDGNFLGSVWTWTAMNIKAVKERRIIPEFRVQLMGGIRKSLWYTIGLKKEQETEKCRKPGKDVSRDLLRGFMSWVLQINTARKRLEGKNRVPFIYWAGVGDIPFPAMQQILYKEGLTRLTKATVDEIKSSNSEYINDTNDLFLAQDGIYDDDIDSSEENKKAILSQIENYAKKKISKEEFEKKFIKINKDDFDTYKNKTSTNGYWGMYVNYFPSDVPVKILYEEGTPLEIKLRNINKV